MGGVKSPNYGVTPNRASASCSEVTLSRVIEMAWEDRTPFEAIEYNYGLNEAAVIAVMRRELKPRSFKRWRERVVGRKTKHRQLRSRQVHRSHCSTQYKIKSNKSSPAKRS